MNKRIIAIVMVFQLLLAMSCSYAENISPRADLVFADANAILCSGKYVVFTSSTYELSGTVSVPAVHLEKKVNGEWTYVTDLECPPSQSSCLRYSQTVYYTEEIGTGTYRVVATFCADGHSITRTSNERTY